MTQKFILIITLFLFTLILACGKGEKEPNTRQAESSRVQTNQDLPKAAPDEALVVESDSGKGKLASYYKLPHIQEFYEWQGLEEVDLPPLKAPDDLSSLSYEELRLLRNEVFARNGYLFKDGFLRGYFNRFKWYRPIFDVKDFVVVFNEEEKKLIERVQEEEARRKEQKALEKDGLTLLNADLVANARQFRKVDPAILTDLAAQNFSVVDANRSMPFYVYDQNAYEHIPHYITTDSYLFILHKYFGTFLEKLEGNYMQETLASILKETDAKLKNLPEGEHAQAADWAKTFCALALHAAGEEGLSVPASYQQVFELEKSNIEQASGNAEFIKNEFVSLKELKARGHYTKTEALKKYFKAFKWLSLNGINLDDDLQLKGMALMAFSIKNDSRLLKQYREYVSVVEELAGPEDNVSMSDIIEAMNTSSLDEAMSDAALAKLRSTLKALNKEKIRPVFGESFKTPERELKRVHFFSGTWSISAEIFSKLVHVDRDRSKRPFPRALDVPAVFGNQTAENIILNEYRDGQAWPDFVPRLEDLQKHFAGFNDWDRSYGAKGVQTALAACAEQPAYPDFMKTDAYNRKELSTMLSSWTHIKHDLILYQEKPFAAEAGQGGGPEAPQHYSYVEPNMAFWKSARELVDWLEGLQKYEDNYKGELKRIKDLGSLLSEVAGKQLAGEKVDEESYRELHYIGGTLEYILFGLLETDHLPDREKSMALIADVYAYNGMQLNVAVGHADDIYVLVPIKGEYYIASGPVFSFYEFKGDIMTDEEWKAEVEADREPARPEWLKPLIRQVPPLEGAMEFRYVGHGGSN
jgi:hypothetical protein